MAKRAIGLIRVSNTGGRGGETFHSPDTQRERIVKECERQGFDLIEVQEELDVSGGKPIEDRPGLRTAILAIENGDAEVLVAAYLDRLTRSVRVRGEVIERVEAAGGIVLTVDMGVQTDATASQWLTGTMNSAVAEYLRRTTAERTAVAVQRAIDRGIPPWAGVPPGYTRRVVGRARNGRKMWGPMEPDTPLVPVIVRAFELREGASTLKEIRQFLRENGVKRSYHGVQAMFGSKVYLGQIHFGDYEPNLSAHPAIIEPDLWAAAQQAIPRGARPRSDRLLARLGVLRCGSCGARLVVGVQTQNGRRYPLYRCSPVGDCTRRVTISARIVEGFAVETVKKALAGLEGRASAIESVRDAEVALEDAQGKLDSSIRLLDGFEDEGVAADRLRTLKAERDSARSHLDSLSSLRSDITVTVDQWDEFPPDIQRGLIRATIGRIEVAAGGKGLERLSVQLLV